MALEETPSALRVDFKSCGVYSAKHALGVYFVVDKVVSRSRTQLEKLFRKRDKMPLVVV